MAVPSTVVLAKLKDQAFPQPYLEKACTLFPTCFGIASVENGRLGVIHMRAAPQVDQLMKLMDEMKDAALVLWLANYPQTFLDEDMQPFKSIVTGEGKEEDVHLALALSGDFTPCTQKDSAHSNDYHAAEKLEEDLLEKFSLAGNNIEPVIRALAVNDQKRIKQLFGSLFTKQGSLIMLAKTGEIVPVNALKYPWGYSTDAMGLAEGEFPKKEESLADRLRGAAAAILPGIKPTPGPAAATLPPIAAAIPPPPKTDTAPPRLLVQASPVIHKSKNQKKDHYNRYAGFCPEGYKNCPVVVSNRSPEHYAELGGVTKACPGGLPKDLEPKHIAPPTSVPKLPGIKATETPATPDKPVEPPATPPADQPAVPDAPAIPPAEIERFNKIAAALDARPILDPREYQAMEEKWPDFADKTGKDDISYIRNWPPENFVDLAEQCPRLIALLCFNLRNEKVRTDPQWGAQPAQGETILPRIAGIKK